MTVEMIQLDRPHARYKETYIAGLLEFQNEGLPWMLDIDIAQLQKNFGDFVSGELNKWTLWTKDTPVKESVFWAIQNDEFVGKISIRHQLNADLKILGGHIGYDTRPSYRGRGVASSMLRQALPIARDIGISEALLTCNANNFHSIRVIEKNGGVLIEEKLQHEGGPLKRYYLIK